MDEVAFEELKGTANMQLHLDRRWVDKRVWPAINVNTSGARHEDVLPDPEEIGMSRFCAKSSVGRPLSRPWDCWSANSAIAAATPGSS